MFSTKRLVICDVKQNKSHIKVKRVPRFLTDSLPMKVTGHSCIGFQIRKLNLLEKYFWRTSKTSCLFMATRASTSSSNVKSGSHFSMLLNNNLVGLLLSSVGSKILHFSGGILSALARCLQWWVESSFNMSVIRSSRSESSRMSLTGPSPSNVKQTVSKKESLKIP